MQRSPPRCPEGPARAVSEAEAVKFLGSTDFEMNEVHVFPDVNVLLHFPAFDGLDWKTMCNASSVVIHITQPLLTELNKVKDTGTTKRVRKRAAAVQKQIKEFLAADGLSKEIKPGIRVMLESRSPKTSEFPSLNPAVSDDILIASLLTFCNETNNEAILATDDDGLALIIKARESNIRVVEPPENARLAAELDSDEKENIEIRRRLSKFENARPKLDITFTTGDDALHITYPKASSDKEISQAIAKLRREHPRLQNPRDPLDYRQMALARIIASYQGSSGTLDDPEAIASYNSELEGFFTDYETVYRANKLVEARMFELNIQIGNIGAVPAEDVLVNLHFPNGFKLFERDDDPEFLTDLPNPPRRPGDKRGDLHQIYNMANIGLDKIHALNSSSPSLSIRETNSYEVAWQIPKLRQEFVSSIDPIVLLYDDEPFSFSIDYRMVADNLPESVSGKLHVIVDKAKGSGE